MMRTDTPIAPPWQSRATLDAVVFTQEQRRAGFGSFLEVPRSYLGPMITVLRADFPVEYLGIGGEGAVAAGCPAGSGLLHRAGGIAEVCRPEGCRAERREATA